MMVKELLFAIIVSFAFSSSATDPPADPNAEFALVDGDDKAGGSRTIDAADNRNDYAARICNTYATNCGNLCRPVGFPCGRSCRIQWQTSDPFNAWRTWTWTVNCPCCRYGTPPAPAPGAATTPATTAPTTTTPCRRANLMFVGTQIAAVTVTSAGVCATVCRAVPTCTHWNFATTACQLLSASTSSATATGVVSGTRTCF